MASATSSPQSILQEIEFTLYNGNDYTHNISDPPGWLIDIKWTSEPYYRHGQSHSSYAISLAPRSDELPILPPKFEAKTFHSGSFVTSGYLPGAAATKWQPITQASTHLLFSQGSVYSGNLQAGYPLDVTVLLRFQRDLYADVRLRSLSRTVTGHILGGGTPDVQFLVFSQRMNGGGAIGAKPLFGKESLLVGKSSEFDALIEVGDFATHEDCPQSVDAATYGYDYDSDLEDLPDDGPLVADDPIARPGNESTAGSRVNDADIPVVDSKKGHTRSDPPAESPKLNASTLLQSAAESTLPSPTVIRSIVIRDGAFVTWYAFIYYIYTGHIVFAPLKSSGAEERKKFIKDYIEKNPDHPSPCSPKSMLRLADKYGLRDLEELSLKQLVSRLTAKNIVSEYFSTFTLMYEKVQKAEFAYLRDHLQTAEVKEAWERQTPDILNDIEMLALSHTTSTKLLFPGKD